ncbi:MAG: LLM class F420-dependent oxidoreductase [Candidatus Eremiobacteraeota bacterium]|nr:LLM class F420-dependent oxidoreductase [Candidatus Eremiobacteraeota bacterium]
MKIGLQIPNFTLPGGPAGLADHLATTARRAEEAGFSSLWVMDHFFQIQHIGPAEMDMLEGYTTLGYLAACTRTIELGTMVTGVTYRYPGLLAKIVTTLDVLSGGRAWLGLGAGWFEREHQGLGVPFPPVAERFEHLEEALQIALQMWSDNNGAFRGKHHRLEETLCVPQPLRRPHPPIMIGGMGEKKTLRLVAQYAQGCNLFEFAGLDTLARKLKLLRGHCQELGTDYQAISKTVLGQTSAADRNAADKLVAKLAQLSELGFDQAIYSLSNPSDQRAFDTFAEHVIPRAGALT